jgi:hypothetical protein
LFGIATRRVYDSNARQRRQQSAAPIHQIVVFFSTFNSFYPDRFLGLSGYFYDFLKKGDPSVFYVKSRLNFPFSRLFTQNLEGY